MVEHLYVHIPFCPKICPYCSFYKEAASRNKTQAFLDAVLTEARRHAPILRPRTVFFGGGTPSALSTAQLTHLLEGLHATVDLSSVEEWTLEMNPATVSFEKAVALRTLGVNRISMGVQSWDPAVLATLGRVHTAEQALRSYGILREAGISQLNLDLMFGIPGQTLSHWIDSLERTIALQPEHISAYCLTYEEDTEFFLRLQQGHYRQNDDRDAEFFEIAMTMLESAGYVQYEISNYSPPGNECRHNLAYWTGKEYIGLGPSAFSTVGRTRTENVSDTAQYIARIEAGASAADSYEELSEQTRRAERIAFSLRTNRGVERDLMADWSREVDAMRREGLLDICNDRWVLTRRGRLVADAIAEGFV